MKRSDVNMRANAYLNDMKRDLTLQETLRVASAMTRLARADVKEAGPAADGGEDILDEEE